ncbi:MAG TPA: TonB-dependent receptor [Rhodanobacteraceae bacterium]
MYKHATGTVSPRHLRGLAVAISLALGTSGVAYAQQAVTGGIYGHAGKQETVTIDALNTGVKRAVQPKANGQFSATALNPGPYEVNILRDGKVVKTGVVVVRPGIMSAATQLATVSGNPQVLQSVVVNASENAAKYSINSIDTSTAQLVTHYDAKLLHDLPVSNDTESIALLQSNVNHEQQTTGSIQVNGATPGANRYFLNGFDITNNTSNIGSFGVPSEAVQSTSVVATGADASWSNALGGVVMTNVKQGSDKFKAGYVLNFVPPTSKFFRPLSKGSTNSQGTPYMYYPHADHDAVQITNDYWASGPLIKHKVFLYALVSQDLPRANDSFGSTSKSHYTNGNDTGLFNLTWDITNKQTLDLIGEYNHSSSFDQTYQLNTPFDPSSVGADTGWSTGDSITRYGIADYHWLVSTNFHVHLMAGIAAIRSTSNNSALESASTSDSGNPIVCATSVDPVTQVGTLLSAQNVCTISNPTTALTRGYKADFTWWVGSNRIQFGGQKYNESSNEGFHTVAGGDWTYQDLPGIILSNGSTISKTDGKFVTRQLFSEIRVGHTSRTAAYVQDSWQATDNWLLYGGVRWTRSKYKVQGGIPVLTLHNYSPRVGFSWDVHGDSTLKIGGTLGEYTLPMPMNFSAVIGQVDPLSYKYYTYTGINPDGSPQGIKQIGSTLISDAAVPTPAAQKISHNLKGMRAYAFSLYAQQKLSDAWTGMVAFTGEDLNRVIDQTCLNTPLMDVAHAAGFTNYNISNTDNSLCTYFNPGNDITVTRDFAGDGKLETLTVPKAMIKAPKPTHHYWSMTLQATHKPTDTQPFFLDLSYTFQREYGNYDGLLDLSHFNPGYPADTYQYTYPVMSIGGNGNLSDDIRNTAVASGIYYFNHGWAKGLTVGASWRFTTGAPFSCLGTYPDSSNPAAIARGPQSHFCGGVLMKQGSLRMPSHWELGLSAGYHWQFGKNKLFVKLAAQNITNNQRAISRYPYHDEQFLTPTTLKMNPYYFTVSSRQEPRFFSLTVRYQFN